MRIDSSGNAIFTKSGGAYLQLKDASAVRGAINVTTSDGLIFTTGSSFTERMRIDSTGNVGIGTDSPKTPLNVADNNNDNNLPTLGTASGVLSISNLANQYGLLGGVLQSSGDSWLQAQRTDGPATAYNILLNPVGGNVGIGTSNPANKLVVAEATGQNGIEIAPGNVSFIQAYDRGTSDYGAMRIDAKYIALATDNGTERMRIDASGNLLVGTPSGSGNKINCVASGSDRNLLMQCANGGANAVTLNTSGTADYSAFIFTTAGGSTQTGGIVVRATSTSFNTSSDYRLKDITGPLQGSGDYIDSLKPVEGTWKSDGSVFVGLLAHEADEVSRTKIATGEKDGEEMQGMSYSSSEMIANLIKEVQSLRNRVAQLEG
tara:strand:- start:1083 stop:2210 length:1128 start_codon:yes stop_codon:yes gene_type:complete